MIVPQNLAELKSHLAHIEPETFFLAGGTDLNVQIRKGILQPSEIVFINRIPEMREIALQDGFISIGATATFMEMLESPIIGKHLPMLQTALQNFASPLLQSTATIGGNIANGSPTADVIPLLLVCDAKLELLSADGVRTVAGNDFYYGYKKNLLERGEIIYRVLIDQDAQQGRKFFYKKVASRKSLTISKASIAILSKWNSDRIESISIAAGSLNEYARRLPQTESLLTGKRRDEISDAILRETLSNEITPISDLRSDSDYRFEVFFNLLIRHIEDVTNG